MKKSHIFGILIIGVAIAIIISTSGDASSYVSFNEAQSMAENGNDKLIHVVGTLKKDPQGEVVGLKTYENKMSFSFIMVDNNNREQEVFYKEPMPADFFMSEQVVVVGSYHDEVFVADEILLKCPSKYEETEVTI